MTIEELERQIAARKTSVTPTPTPINLGSNTASTTPQFTEQAKANLNANISKVTRPLNQGLGWVNEKILMPTEYAYAGAVKGAMDKKAEQVGSASKFEVTVPPKQAWERTKAAASGAISGLKNKTAISDIELAKKGFGVQNPYVAAAIDTATSIAIPTLPFEKIAKASKLNKIIPEVGKLGIRAAEKTPVLSNVVKFGKKFSYAESAPKRFLGKFEQLNRDTSKLAEKTQEVYEPLKYSQTEKKLKFFKKELPKQEQTLIGDVLNITGTHNVDSPKIIIEQAKKREALTKELLDIQMKKQGLKESFKFGGRVNTTQPLLLQAGKGVGDGKIKKVKQLMKSGEGFILPTSEQKKLVKLLNKGDARATQIIDELSKLGATTRGLTEAEQKIVNKYKNLADATLNKFKKQAIEDIRAGADPKIYERLFGKYYGKNLYTSVLEGSGKGSKFVKNGNIGLDLGRYKKRLDLPEEVAAAIGKVKEPAAGAALAYYGTGKNILMRNFFKDVAKKYVLPEGTGGLGAYMKGEKATKLKTIPKGYVRLPKSEKLGILSERLVPEQIATYLTEVVAKAPETVGSFITQEFKKNKTIRSPKQLFRNMIASPIQSYMNPNGRADAILQIKAATTSFIKKDKYYKEAKSIGLIGKTQASEVMGDAMSGVLSGLNTGRNPLIDKYKKITRVTDKPGAFVQNATEEINKLSVFINERKHGKSVFDAAKLAEETGFNYDKVSPFVRELRSGKAKLGPLPFSIPFITYPMKAAELTAKTLYKKPQRLKNIGSVERGIQSTSTGPNERFLPDYLKDAVRTPFTNSKTKNPIYYNSKYIYPWGNLIGGEMSPNILAGNTPMGLTPDPIFSEAVAQITGTDQFTGKPLSAGNMFGQGDWSGRLRHAVETFGATPIRSATKAIDASTKKKTSATDPSVTESILREMGQPIYQYDYNSGFQSQDYQKTQKVAAAKAALKKYQEETLPSSLGYQYRVNKLKQAWLDAMRGK